MITCGWCNVHYKSWQSKCDSCGGPMPPLPGQELGPEPPPTPRELPAGYEFRLKWWGNIAVIIGLIFGLIPALVAMGLLVAGNWFAIIPAFFALGGFTLFRYGRRKAARIIKAFRHGIATRGEVASLGLDTTMSVNNQHPWKLIYHFTVEGHTHEGVVSSFDSTLSKRSAGQPLWVLYAANDPQQNTLYPPVRYF